MNIFDLVKQLTEADVEYVVVGGLAVALQGYQRATLDVDVVLAMTPENLGRFIACAKSAGLRPLIPVEIDSLAQPELLEKWHREKGMLAFGLRGEDMMTPVVDVLIKPVIDFAALRRDASVVSVGDLRVPIASIDHLITMKTGTGRSKDQIDTSQDQGGSDAVTGEENLRLLERMDAHRRFMFQVYLDNPALAANAEPRVREVCSCFQEKTLKIDALRQSATAAQRGFTMVELVVTIVILGIVSAVVMPRFASLGAFDAAGYGDQVQALLRYAHKTAVAQRAMVLTDYSSAKLCVKTDGSNTCSTASCADLPLPGGAWKTPIASTTVSGGTLYCFDSIGRPYDGSGKLTATATLNVQDSGATIRSIRIEAETGYVH